MITSGTACRVERRGFRSGGVTYRPLFYSSPLNGLSSGYFKGVSTGDLKPVAHVKCGVGNTYATPLVSGNHKGLTEFIPSDASDRDVESNWYPCLKSKPGLTVYCSVYPYDNGYRDRTFVCDVFVFTGIYATSAGKQYLCGDMGRLRASFADDGSHCFVSSVSYASYYKGVPGLSERVNNLLTPVLRDLTRSWRTQKYGSTLYPYPTSKDMLAFVRLECESLFICLDGKYPYNQWGETAIPGTYTVDPAWDSAQAVQAFLFHEEDCPDYGAPLFLRSSASRYWLNLLRERAFVDACGNMPALSDNSISNAQEILEFLLSVIRHEPLNVPSKLNEAWLAYRYQYTTTKLDIKEAWNFVNRYYDLDSMFMKGTAHGTFSQLVGGVSVTCRAAVEVAPQHNRWYNDLSVLWRDLSTLGLAPDLYYIWDSTPFSFIVDWFLPVGSVLESVDSNLLYCQQNYQFGNICYSLTYDRTIGGKHYHCYSRWIESSPPSYNPMFWMEPGAPTSKRTAIYRVADAISLCIGGLT